MIIFLDIDGVLNCYKSFQNRLNGNHTNLIFWKGYGLTEFVDIEFVNRLNEIKRETNAKIVGISSWFSQRRPNDISDISNAIGIEFHDKIDSTGGGLSRLGGITRYLEKYNIKDFIIIDDDPIHQTKYKSRHIMPIGNGLTEELKENAISICAML